MSRYPPAKTDAGTLPLRLSSRRRGPIPHSLRQHVIPSAAKPRNLVAIAPLPSVPPPHCPNSPPPDTLPPCKNYATPRTQRTLPKALSTTARPIATSRPNASPAVSPATKTPENMDSTPNTSPLNNSKNSKAPWKSSISHRKSPTSPLCHPPIAQIPHLLLPSPHVLASFICIQKPYTCPR